MFVTLTGAIFFILAFIVPINVVAPVGAVNPAHEPPALMRVIFVGDMMFDRSVRAALEREGYDHALSCVADLFQGADLVVGNLEGPITAHPSKSLGSEIGSPENFTFTFDPQVAQLLARHNVRAVSLGNNHGSDFGRDGVRSTIRYLREAGVAHFGDRIDHAARPWDEHGVPLTFVAYNQFGGGEDTTISQIRTARGSGRMPVVFAHWGDEYVSANDSQKALARRFVDAGAEIVIGAHPHVVQESEAYAGKHIYYSLGNFIFDQYWNDDVRSGLMLDVTFSSSGVWMVKEIPTYIERFGRPCIIGQDPA